MLCLRAAGKSKTLKFDIYPKNKSHDCRPYISDRDRGCRMNGHRIGKKINEQSKQKAQADKGGPVFLNGIDKSKKVEPIKDEYLYEYKQCEPDNIYKITIAH